MSIFVSQPCAYPAAPPLTQDLGHGISNVFSSSANPDDWTQISNLVERRRIQNRIAQRNYRKKHKSHLENLERRFGSSDAASDQPKKTTTTKKRSPPRSKSQPHAAKSVASQGRFPPPIEPSDGLFFPGTFYDLARSNCPPQFTYPTSPGLEEILVAPDGATQPDLTMTRDNTYADFLTASTVPMAPLSIPHFRGIMRREPCPSDDGTNLYIAYNYMPSLDPESSSPCDQFNDHTSPLSHSYRLSANCFEVGYDYSATPQSMLSSPGLIYPQ